MSSRVSVSERRSQRLCELLGELPDGEALFEVMKLGMRKIVGEALKAEVSDALGRGYYECGSEPGRGYRNGTRTARLRTAEGVVEYRRAAGRRSNDPRAARATDAGPRGTGCRDVRARPFEAGHRVGLPRRGRPVDSLAQSGLGRGRATLGRSARTFAARDLAESLVVYFSWHCRTAAVPTAPRCSCTWRRARRKTPRASGPSFSI